jgi:hypothetical protein
MMRLWVSPLAVIALALGLSVTTAEGDGRDDWRDYSWQSVAFDDCPDKDEAGLCHPYHEKWDWKRDQWVDFLYAADRTSGALTTRLRLVNRDRRDSDYVCVTALFVDPDGNDVFAFHQNWHIDASQVRDETLTFEAPPAAWSKVAKVLIGSKQCRRGSKQDDALFARVKVAIGQAN